PGSSAIFAPFRTAPETSVIWPVIVPLCACAYAFPASMKIRIANNKTNADTRLLMCVKGVLLLELENRECRACASACERNTPCFNRHQETSNRVYLYVRPITTELAPGYAAMRIT